jgi:hypothetical protein
VSKKQLDARAPSTIYSDTHSKVSEKSDAQKASAIVASAALVIDDFRINDTMAQSLLCKRVVYAWVRVHQNLKQEKLLMMMAKTSSAVFFIYFHSARVPLKFLV